MDSVSERASRHDAERASGGGYREHLPPSSLRGEVECIWTMESGGDGRPGRRHRVLPDGCSDIIVSLVDPPPATEPGAPGPATRVVGTMTKPLLVERRDRMRLVGVRFRPGGATPFLGAPAGEVVDRVVPLEDLWGSGAARLRERMLEAPDPEARVRRLAESLVRRRSRSRLEADPVVLRAARLLGGASIGEVASAVGLGPRQLLRRFRASTGIGTKRADRILRFRRVARRLRSRPERSLAALALEAGYADQAHLTREFRRLAGIPPGAYRKRSGGR